MCKGSYLGEFEQLVLVALLRLGDNAYGMKIRQELAQRAEREVAIGAVYATLDRLHAKGLVTSWNGEATPERGGRAKRYFKLTAEGERALRASRTAWARMWDGLSFGTVPG